MQNASMLLIVDDCAEDREAYRRYLLKDSHQSYQIIEADDAEDGLNLSQESLCDAILLDFQLPDMDGLEFLDRLKGSHAETPVIMLTAHGDEEVAVQAMKRGAQDYLVKHHLKPEVLQLAVRNVIKQNRLQRRLGKTQEHQRLIATIALRIRQSLDLQQTLDTAVAEVRQLLKCDRVVVYQLTPNLTGKIVAESVAPNWPPILGYLISDLDFQLGEPEDNSEESKKTIHNIYQAGLSQGHVDLLTHFEVKANLSAPITLSGIGGAPPKLWGMLAAHQCSSTRRWQADEIEILDALSVQLAIAIQQAELLAQTQTALEKQKELNNFKSQIIATVSHEYQSPLAAILAAASTLSNHGDELNESTQQHFLQIVEQKAKHMSNLVSDMLAVNQAELNKTQFNP
ncbi:MAG: response regulator, partial [Leptolyngbyaceae cyanobacterium MO_188.B28]|nr:response regulator [Leptolyngbyaceae cyanobacterium MO_188.B28]